MSELVRKALRRYERNIWWDETNAYGRKMAEAAGIRDDHGEIEGTSPISLTAGEKIRSLS
jgi:hypothetical protein